MNIKNLVYFPRLGGYRFTDKQCAFGVESHQDKNGRWRRYHQCDYKPAHLIDGYVFCTQHKKFIESRKNL